MICKHFGKCGGCSFQDISYKEELEWKRNLIQSYFPSLEIPDVIPSPKEFFYRNKMDFSVHRGKVGLRRKGTWWDVINLEECLIFSENTSKYLETIRNRLNLDEISYDIIKKKGFLRYIVIREAKFTKSKMVIFVTTRERKMDFSTFLDMFSSVVWEINDSLSDVSYGDVEMIWGEKYWKEKFYKYTFYFPPNSFSQTNSYAAQILYKLVDDIVDGGKTLVDAYAGVGTFGIILSEKFDRVIGIEDWKASVEGFKKNREELGIENYEMIEGKVERELRKIKNYDFLLLDPPRSGCHPKVMRWILDSLPKRILYVSCNPKTQRRDVDVLLDKYEITYVQPIDMFPKTQHVENVLLLERKL